MRGDVAAYLMSVNVETRAQFQFGGKYPHKGKRCSHGACVHLQTHDDVTSLLEMGWDKV